MARAVDRANGTMRWYSEFFGEELTNKIGRLSLSFEKKKKKKKKKDGGHGWDGITKGKKD